MKKQRDKKLAKELAARLDAGVLEPTDADSAEMQDLLAIYACLDSAVEEPSPKLQRWVKRLLKESSFRERWFAWLPHYLHPVLVGTATSALVIVLLMPVLSFLWRTWFSVGDADVMLSAVRTERTGLLWSIVLLLAAIVGFVVWQVVRRVRCRAAAGEEEEQEQE